MFLINFFNPTYFLLLMRKVPRESSMNITLLRSDNTDTLLAPGTLIEDLMLCG